MDLIQSLFRPAPPDGRDQLRANIGWADQFIFLHVGAMTPNENIPQLLRAFAVVAQSHPQVRLLLKGLDTLYVSSPHDRESAATLTPAQAALVQPRLRCTVEGLSMAAMAQLYQMADAYVSPYSAEGFNLPALEAAASGCPLICTAGGPTDDFTTADFCLPIAAAITPVAHGSVTGKCFQINFDSLVAQMLRIVEDDAFRRRAAEAGPPSVRAGFTWKLVTDRLLSVLGI